MLVRRLSLLLLLLLTLLAGSLYGQVTVGVKKGLSLGSAYAMDNPGDGKKTPVVGFAGGIFTEISLSGRFSLQPELLFSRRGVKEVESDYDYTWIASYVDLPVLAKMNFSFLRELLQASIYLGPQFSFGLASSFHADDPGYSEDYSPDIEPFDLGLAVGAEGGVRLAPFDLFVDLRYVLGFLPIVDPGDAQGQRPKSTMFAVLFGVGYTL